MVRLLQCTSVKFNLHNEMELDALDVWLLGLRDMLHIVTSSNKSFRALRRPDPSIQPC